MSPDARQAEPGFVVGVDGGGTRSRAALADTGGREILRRAGPAGLVDPRDPDAAATRVARLVREAADAGGAPLPVLSVCAGLAGVGDPQVRAAVQAVLERSGVARSVEVTTDGQVGLEGALGGDAGVLLVAGTGSIAYGRSPDGRVERSGGWGMLVGDEGSGWQVARAGIQAALQALDGRIEATRLTNLLDGLPPSTPRHVPSWVARSGKADVAALAPRVVDLAEEGDAVARRVVDAAAADLARHVDALLRRLGPWSPPVPVVFQGGLLEHPGYARRVEVCLRDAPVPVTLRAAAADAVTGALRRALALAAGAF